MSNEWSEMPLGAALEVLIDYRGKSPPKSLTGVPVISAKVVKGGRITYPIEQTIAPEYYKIWMSRGLPKVGDIVMTTEGPMGEVAQLDEMTVKFALGQRIVCMRGRRGFLDNTYLKFLLMSPVQQAVLHSYATGTTVAGISQKAIRSVPIILPSFEKQVVIGRLLACLDNKIALNRRMNQTIEAMGRSLFKDWFVDFGPTRAKMEGRIPYLAPEIWALFPDRLDDEGKPAGWTMTSLKRHATIVKGRSYASTELAASNIALVTLKSFARGGGYRRDGLKSYTGEFKEAQIVKEGEIVIAQTDVTQAAEIIGRPARVIEDYRFRKLVASLDVAILRPIAGNCLDEEFLFGLTRQDAFTQHAIAHSTGTTVLHLSRDAIPKFQFAIPTKATVAQHAIVAEPMTRRIAANVHESDALAALRALLLPKLISGELRIRDAERVIEAVV